MTTVTVTLNLPLLTAYILYLIGAVLVFRHVYEGNGCADAFASGFFAALWPIVFPIAFVVTAIKRVRERIRLHE